MFIWNYMKFIWNWSFVAHHTMKGEKDLKFCRNCWKEYCFQEIIQYVLIPSPPPQSLKHSSYFVPTRFYKGFPISMFLLFTSHHELLTEILFSWGEPFWSLPCFSPHNHQIIIIITIIIIIIIIILIIVISIIIIIILRSKVVELGEQICAIFPPLPILC